MTLTIEACLPIMLTLQPPAATVPTPTSHQNPLALPADRKAHVYPPVLCSVARNQNWRLATRSQREGWQHDQRVRVPVGGSVRIRRSTAPPRLGRRD